MFPLKNRKVGGFTFKQKYPQSFGSLAGHPHLGVDYSAKIGTPIYAPFDGSIGVITTGAQGGLTIWFKPYHDNVIMRFMHLSQFKCKAGDKLKEGDLIGLTGNTGSATNAPHLHLDISKGSVQITKIDNFLDPEKYTWKTKTTQNLTQEDKKIDIIVDTPVEVKKPAIYDCGACESITDSFWRRFLTFLLNFIK